MYACQHIFRLKDCGIARDVVIVKQLVILGSLILDNEQVTSEQVDILVRYLLLHHSVAGVNHRSIIDCTRSDELQVVVVPQFRGIVVSELLARSQRATLEAEHLSGNYARAL